MKNLRRQTGEPKGLCEFMDDDGGTPLDTSQVNAAELLQAYLGWRVDAPSAAVKTSAVTVGRQTIDFGGRRLLARSAFRNTINGFTGVAWQTLGACRT